jgi:hypothetical protein
MLNEFETEMRQQGLIFGRIEACMVQRIASIRAHSLAMTKAGIEHQNGGWRRVRGKYAKHRSLVFVPEMKEAVPSQYPAKSPAEGQ